MSRTRMTVVGVGHLGKEHARILAGMPDVHLVGVADVNRQQAESVAMRWGTAATDDFRTLLGKVDAAVIAVPTSYHLNVASAFIEHGTAVLVEKPLALNFEQARQIVTLAEQHHSILQVGHIERFNPAWEELQRRPLRPKFIAGERFSPYSGRSTDIGVVLDVMIHDLDLVLSYVDSPVRSVQAVGFSLLGGHEDMVQASLQFANGCVAQLRAGRIHPHSHRQMQIMGSEGVASIDFARRKLTLMQPTRAFHQARKDPRKFEASAHTLKNELFGHYMQTLELDCNRGDQLTCELQDFVRAVRSDSQPRVSGKAGVEAMSLASQILDCVKSHQWEGTVDGPTGPNQLPIPQGKLFVEMSEQAAA